MLFTVDEARALKPAFAQIKELKKEFRIYKNVVNAFSIWFFILTTVRALVVSTVIVSMFNQEPNLLVAWNKGDGVTFFIVYLIVSCIPLIGNLVNLIAPIAIVIAAFTVGDGIMGNFAPFVLPIAIAYAVTFGLIFFSNSLINSIIKSSCPKIYESIMALTGRGITYNESGKNNENDDIEEAEIIDYTDDEYDDDML